MAVSSFLRPNLIESRIYQEVLAARVLEKGNSLIVAPTALGKTIVAALVVNQLLIRFPSKKILLLSPTKPLAAQHCQSFRRLFDIPEDQVLLLTGSTIPSKRLAQWKNACIISATPQAIENDVLTGQLSFQDVSLMIFDEAHRAVGDYSYVFLASRYVKQAASPLILGLTASPGSNQEKIQDVCKNLFIENVEIKTLVDHDVQPYVHDIDFDWVTVTLPEEFLVIKGLLREFQREQLSFLKKVGLGRELSGSFVRRVDLLRVQARLRQTISSRAEKNPALWAAVSRLAALLKVSHAETLLETQGIAPLHEYLDKLRSQKGQPGSPKALKTILSDARIVKAMQLTDQLFEQKKSHPKEEKLVEVVLAQLAKNPAGKMIVFNHYRDSVRNLVSVLEKVPGVKPLRFVGQATKDLDKGLTQKQQLALLEAFRNGDYNVLVASSVGEEGLDIPSVDLVIFFEPVPSEIRMIQRRGRTGRWTDGKCVVLVAKGTRDEAYLWASRAKEKNMHRILSTMQKQSEPVASQRLPLQDKQTTLGKFMDSDVLEIFVDSREQASSVVRELVEAGVFVRSKQLEIGDYVVGPEVIIERKTTEDFLSSMIDGRLFVQLKSMTESYKQPVMILEGHPSELFSLRNVHKNAILGALSSIAVDYRIPILFSQSSHETAEFLVTLARREQFGKEKDLRIRTGRKGLTLAESQRFLVESLPMVGPTMAKSLLSHFGSIKAIVNATEKELQNVHNMGEKKAKRIVRLLSAPYRGEDSSEQSKREKKEPVEKKIESDEADESVEKTVTEEWSE